MGMDYLKYVIWSIAVNSVSLVYANVMPPPEELFERASYHYYRNEYSQSRAYFEQAIIHDPTNATLLFNAGLLNWIEGNSARAIELYDAALTHNPNYTKAQQFRHTLLIDQATFCMKNHHISQAIAYYQKALQDDPNQPEILYNIAYALRLQGDDARAIPYYEQTLTLAPNNEHAHFGYSKALLAIGNFERGWQEFEWRWHDSQRYIREFGHHNLTPELLRGKRVLLRAEWGLGDTIQFIRYAQLLKEYGAHVIAQVDEPLVKLFSPCPYLDALVPVGHAFPHFDYQIPLLSLPLLFKTTLETIPNVTPYIFVDATITASWQNALAHDTQFKIGICWQAKPDIFLEQHPTTKRSVPLELFYDIARIPGVSIYSLQQQNGCDQLEHIPADITIHTFDTDPSTGLRTGFDKTNGRYVDTAGVMQQLDLIISVDTSVIHLAGALAKEVFVLLPSVAEWRWMHGRTDTPWYPNMRLFRQQTPGEWQSVIAAIKDNIEQRLLTNANSMI